MSLDATNWAWKAPVETSSQRVVLLSMADRAGEDHTAYPSVARLAKDCVLNRKTVMKVADQLEELGLLQDTGKTRGNGVKVYRLIGVNGREESTLTSTKSGTYPKNGTSTKSGISSSTKSGTATSTKSGTQNLPMNLSIESKNKKEWFSWEKLRKELVYLQDPNLINEIKNASWFERELKAFENFNADKNLSDEMMMYHFADKLVQAVEKYRALESKTHTENKKPESQKPNKGLSEKQISFFAHQLSLLPEYAGKHAQVGETYEDLAKRISGDLRKPDGVKNLMPYLKQVGYEQKGANA